MISYGESVALLLEAAPVMPSELLPIEAAEGRYIADPVHAAIDAPRADVSVMDGYAVRFAEVGGENWLRVAGTSSAGETFAGKVPARQAVRIFTGAHVPSGTDCIVMQEHAERDGEYVRFRKGFGPARHIRRRASDFATGETLLSEGERLTARAMVALAAADIGHVEVAIKPRITILATGDELASPGSARLAPNTQPDSASFGVAALARDWGAIVGDLLRGRDDLEHLSRLASTAVENTDCVVVIGGASVGDRDLARPMFDGLPLRDVFAKVAIRPGRPVWLGIIGDIPVLGLPGNPTSAMVAARLFLAPLLVAMQGGRGLDCIRDTPQILAGKLAAAGSRESFVRAQGTGEGLMPVDNQDSGAQAPLASSDWLIRRPPGDQARNAGDIVRAISF